ncbi:MAG: septum formation protein Maf [Bacteroidales bacterium]|nr:septum formation protein Maf [Bacteroidales bacterium]
MLLNGKRLILGSNSPRRLELLKGLDLDFVVDAQTSFEERVAPSVPHKQVPVLMSEGKSLGFHRPLEKDELLLTADTMVLLGKIILGKPRDEQDACRMLRLLSGRTHDVITAVTLRSGEGAFKTLVDRSRVTFNELSKEEIHYYVEKYRPLDKAGAYGVQEWIGYIGIRAVEGSFYTVMGLPVHLVYALLKEFA